MYNEKSIHKLTKFYSNILYSDNSVDIITTFQLNLPGTTYM